MPINPSFLDSLFDINGDGKVNDIDFMDDTAIFSMIQEDEEEEELDDPTFNIDDQDP